MYSPTLQFFGNELLKNISVFENDKIVLHQSLHPITHQTDSRETLSRDTILRFHYIIAILLLSTVKGKHFRKIKLLSHYCDIHDQTYFEIQLLYVFLVRTTQ